MHTKIKICGIKTNEEIAIINQYSVNYIGFIFAKSKRQITKDKVIELRSELKDGVQTVGVFVNENIETVNNIIDDCKLDVIQLHGGESVDYCSQVKAKVWKSISIKDESSLEIISKYEHVVEGVLLDTFYKGETGGTGKTFDWEGIAKALEAINPKCKLIIAGGISPANARKAIDIFNPDVIDLNSKLETNLIKDNKKISALFNNLTQ